MGIRIGELDSEILKEVEKYFTNLQKWGSLFINDPTDEVSIVKIISEYEKLEDNFVNFKEGALNQLNSFQNMLLWGRRGTGKSTYLTKSFFHHIYGFSRKKRIVPIFIDCNLLFKRDLDERILNISYFYAGLKSQIVKSLLFFQELLQYLGKKKFELDNEDIADIKLERLDFRPDEFNFELNRQKYDQFLEKYSEQLYNNIVNKKPINFDSIHLLLLELKKRWKLDGFIFYIDEVSEFFIAKGYFKESVRNYFLEFLSECIPKLCNIFTFKLVLYQEKDFEKLQEDAPLKFRIDRKYFNTYANLDLFDENKYFGKKIGKKGTNIKRQYEEDLNNHINGMFSKASKQWQRVFYEFEKIDINNQIYKYLRESTGGTIRELGYVITEAIKQANGTNKITIQNLRASIIAHYKKKQSYLLSKEIRLMEEIITDKKKNKDPNVVYFTDRISLEAYNDIEKKKVYSLFKHSFISELEQAFLINIVSMIKSNGETEYLYVYHPGYGFSLTWSDEIMEFDSNELRNTALYIAQNMRFRTLFFNYFQNYLKKIEEEEKSTKKDFLQLITQGLKEKGQSQTTIERFILPGLKNQSIYALKLFCEEVEIDLTSIQRTEDEDQELKIEKEETKKPTEPYLSVEWFDNFLEKARKKLIRTQYLKDYLNIIEIIFNSNGKANLEYITENMNTTYPEKQRKYFMSFLKKKTVIIESDEGVFQLNIK